MRFSGQLYPYQEEILSVFESEREKGEKKIHIVAPPGAGKTIVGLEMLRRLGEASLILVPNLTLQEQWKDKIEKLFLEHGENINHLVSTDIAHIRKINIITYQSLSGSGNTENDDELKKKILSLWYEAEKSEHKDFTEFLYYIDDLKESNREMYNDGYGKYRNVLKKSGDTEFTRKLMKDTLLEYVIQLKTYGIGTMIVDEAHHLTSWWSHVLYEIWSGLGEPYIVGLTATPPFQNVDYFELDESYTKLLGTVDYYVPTPAIVKSGRLAPYSDLAYFVEPDDTLESILQEKEKNLQSFIDIHQREITLFLHGFLLENFEGMKTSSLVNLEKWMRWVYTYKGKEDTTETSSDHTDKEALGSIDMSSYITHGATERLTLEDIAKSIGKWVAQKSKKSKSTTILKEAQSLFFDLGYIWRGSNFYRFETPIEKALIYSKSKILGVQAILATEKKNLGKKLRCAIVTDFLDGESDWINAHYILDCVKDEFAAMNPYLVSGQGIWKYEHGEKVLLDGETILTVTEKLSRGETQLIIGTRGILGEGWDCPELNTLIDLTGVSAYMSVNQVHGRALRPDPGEKEKVANIYDIVCLGKGYSGMRDFERLSRKHSQLYGVSDAGLVIKELEHIYPQLEKHIHNPEKLNAYTLKKSALRSMVRDLWNIGGDYKNQETYSLSIEIVKPYEITPIPSAYSLRDILKINPQEWKKENLLELGKSSYHELVRTWIREIIGASLQVMKVYEIVPMNFNYIMKHSDTGAISITSDYHDTFMVKRFIEIIAPMFGPITDQKYTLVQRRAKDHIEELENKFKRKRVSVGIVGYVAVGLACIIYAGVYDGTIEPENVLAFILYLHVFYFFLYHLSNWLSKGALLENLKNQINKLSSIGEDGIHIGIPDIVSSNEEKRRIFLGETIKSLHHLAIPKRMLKVKQFDRTFADPFSTGFLYRGERRICLEGKILPTSQSDIGKTSFLSSKIEKLWI